MVRIRLEGPKNCFETDFACNKVAGFIQRKVTGEIVNRWLKLRRIVRNVGCQENIFY